MEAHRLILPFGTVKVHSVAVYRLVTTEFRIFHVVYYTVELRGLLTRGRKRFKKYILRLNILFVMHLFLFVPKTALAYEHKFVC